MKRSIRYTLSYAAVLGAVCAILLTAVASFTAPYKTANAKAEEILNILTALKILFPADTSAEQLVEIFNTNIREQNLGEQIIYVYSPTQAKDQTGAVAVRFSGRGLWGPIKGFLALEKDMKTIRGLTFYEQEETPGLGGDIVKPKFREQFAGKSILDAAGKAGIIIKTSDKPTPNQVDAITGATMTCNKVEAILNTVIENIVKESDKDGK